MLTRTLFDITVIIGLQLARVVFDPYEMNKDAFNFDANKATFTHYIFEHHNTTNVESL